jgi:hypothetical protein
MCRSYHFREAERREQMHPSELTISDILRDPMIRQVLRADGISLRAFAVFLQQAARRQLEVTSGSRNAGPLGLSAWLTPAIPP